MRAPSIRDRLYEAPGPRTRRRVAAATALAAIGVGFGILLLVRQFARQGQLEARYWDFFLKGSTLRFLGQGLLSTLKSAFTAALIAIALGFLLMRGRMMPFYIGAGRHGALAVGVGDSDGPGPEKSRRRAYPLKWLCVALIEFTRGVPTLLLIYFFFIVLPRMGVRMSAFWRITLPCAISASGIIAEAFRAGVNAVARGQREAALSLGLSRLRTFYRVVFPQAVRFVVPSLISELVIVLKDTTFAYVVSYPDLMQSAKVLITSHDSLVSVYLVVAVIYILINYGLNRLSDRVARGARLPVAAKKEAP